MSDRLIPVRHKRDIPKAYRKNSIGLLLEYHNLGRAFDVYTQAKLLVGMCMDNRKHLKIPDHFAYIIRAGGANLRPAEFKVSYAIAVGGVTHIAILGHTQCGMVRLIERKKPFIDGLVKRAGWHPKQAEEHFHNYADHFEIGNETDFVLSEAHRLNLRYPKVQVAPLIYKVEDSKIYLVKEDPHL